MGGPGGQSRHFEEEAWYQGSKDPKQFEVTGKIMLSAIVILFAVIVLMVGLHIYARWYLNRARRRHLSRRRRRTHVIFNVDAAAANLAEPPGRGLDASVLSSLPLFTYSPESHPEAPLECAVCLSEFEEKETCRRLPKCDHSFHVGCIDMWFHSHSTCPLCRAPVDDEAPVPDRLPPRQDHVAISVAAEPAESEAATTAPSTSQHGVSTSKLNNDDSTTPSLRRKAAGLVVGVSIEVPGRNAAVFLRSEDQSGAGFQSPAFKSPGGRIRSFTRIISRDHIRAAEALTSPTSAPSCSSVPSEADLERGQSEETQQTRAQTPR